jgi:hypothetical protein
VCSNWLPDTTYCVQVDGGREGGISSTCENGYYYFLGFVGFEAKDPKIIFQNPRVWGVIGSNFKSKSWPTIQGSQASDWSFSCYSLMNNLTLLLFSSEHTHTHTLVRSVHPFRGRLHIFHPFAQCLHNFSSINKRATNVTLPNLTPQVQLGCGGLSHN